MRVKAVNHRRQRARHELDCLGHAASSKSSSPVNVRRNDKRPSADPPHDQLKPTDAMVRLTVLRKYS